MTLFYSLMFIFALVDFPEGETSLKTRRECQSLFWEIKR